jgi:hypothetical protein
MSTSLDFQIAPSLDKSAIEVVQGLGLRSIIFANGPAQGHVVTFRADDFDVRIYPFYELINRSFNAKWGYCPPPEHNSGVNVIELLTWAKPEGKRIPQSEIQRCRFACNTVHTNFVRGNGFVIINGELVYKPPGAVALDGAQYRPLGFHPDRPDGFCYETLSLIPPPPRLRTVRIVRNIIKNQSEIDLAISGPAIVRSSKNVTHEIPVRLKAEGQTVGNEINYNPFTTRTSLTVFGTEKGTNNLIVVSMFAGKPANHDGDITLFIAEEHGGITLYEMAELMILLGASEAIAGGGAGDTQQYIYKQGIKVGQPRIQSDRPQAKGVRGLGAILAVLE